ncbi:MAG: cation transporter [Sulfolobales archaeon]
MLGRVTVKKIVRFYRMANLFKILFISSLTYGLLGVLLYLIVVRSNLILIDSILWILDSITYLTLFIVLKVVTSKTLNGRRYELLRVEDVSSIFIAVITISVVIYLIPSTLANTEITSSEFSLYLIGSGILSYIFSRYVLKYGRYGKVLVKSTAVKTSLDALIEFVNSIALILSNILQLVIIENILVLMVSAYAIKCSVNVVKESVFNLLDINYPRHLKYRIINIVERHANVSVKKVLLRNLGSFVEVELWVRLPSNATLKTTQVLISSMTKEILIKIPEVIKVLVVAIPDKTRVSSKESIPQIINTQPSVVRLNTLST